MLYAAALLLAVTFAVIRFGNEQVQERVIKAYLIVGSCIAFLSLIAWTGGDLPANQPPPETDWKALWWLIPAAAFIACAAFIERMREIKFDPMEQATRWVLRGSFRGRLLGIK